MIHLDTETCGFTGPCVLIQHATDDGPVILHEVWKEPIKRSLMLIERLCDNVICGFNLSFDWFHINKLYNLFRLSSCCSRPPRIEEIVSIQQKRHSEYTQYCLRPKAVLDLFLYSRKTKWQVLMSRREIRIRKIPTIMADHLIGLLTEQVRLSGIYFHFRQGGYEWVVQPIESTGFSDLVLNFAPSGGLKPLSEELFKIKTSEFSIAKEFFPDEQEYNPYTTQWDRVIPYHIRHWHESKRARSYAEQDVILLQRLFHYWAEPIPGDIDSELACCVGAVRWKGFAIDERAVIDRYEKQKLLIEAYPVNLNSPLQVKSWLRETATETEKLVITNTAKEILEELRDWPNEVGKKAIQTIDARRAAKEIDNLIKLFNTRRFCPNFKVIGTKSGRMSGGTDENTSTSSLNPQGIQRVSAFRKLFTFAEESETLSGGDFDSFEVTITHAACLDENLSRDLRSGRSFHAILGSFLYDLSEPEIIATKGSIEDKYGRSKNSAFGIFYGAMPRRIAETAGVSTEKAKSAIEGLLQRYPKFDEFRESIYGAFCSMRQPGGIGSPVIWHEPREYVESLLGFKRYFILENYICKQLFELARGDKIPNILGDVVRRKRIQTNKGAVHSALYSAAFQLQAANMRAALNHVIQSTGAEICKELQKAIWDKQPVGIHPWVVQPANFHDEVMVVHNGVELRDTVNEVIEKFRDVVPLLSITWKENLKNWGDK